MADRSAIARNPCMRPKTRVSDCRLVPQIISDCAPSIILMLMLKHV